MTQSCQHGHYRERKQKCMDYCPRELHLQMTPQWGITSLRKPINGITPSANVNNNDPVKPPRPTNKNKNNT